MKEIRTVFRILLLISLGACCASLEAKESKKAKWYEDLPTTRDVRSKFALFSWLARDGSYRFAVIQNNNQQGRYRFLNRFDRRHTPSISLDELQRHLSTLPPASLVDWTKDVPNRIVYPDHTIIRKVKTICARLHLDLYFSEVMHEAPDV
jgi:hypothetical protein